MTKSARRRFSESGIWSARIAARRAGVIPGRLRTRASCKARGAETTTTASQPSSDPISNRRGNVENHDGPAIACGNRAKTALTGFNEGVNDRLETVESVGLVEHPGRDRPPVDAPTARHARKGGFDGGDGGLVSFHQRVDRVVGVVNRSAQTSERTRRGAFSHADRASQAEDDHGSA